MAGPPFKPWIESTPSWGGRHELPLPARPRRFEVSDGRLVASASGYRRRFGSELHGLGGGFVVVPLLVALGYTPQRAVGTSFVAILLVGLSSLVGHAKLAGGRLEGRASPGRRRCARRAGRPAPPPRRPRTGVPEGLCRHPPRARGLDVLQEIGGVFRIPALAPGRTLVTTIASASPTRITVVPQVTTL